MFLLLLQLTFETEIGIIRQFQFTSERQCMSVVVRGVGESHFTVFCKGSPEKIKSISLPETLPADFETTLDRYRESQNNGPLINVFLCPIFRCNKSTKICPVQAGDNSALNAASLLQLSLRFLSKVEYSRHPNTEPLAVFGLYLLLVPTI
jgi:hypothetical protein